MRDGGLSGGRGGVPAGGGGRVVAAELVGCGKGDKEKMSKL